jgi:hypothetical protein
VAHHDVVFEETVDRRDRRARQAVVASVLTTFSNMPALTLTPPQTARLLGLKTDVSQRVLRQLVQQGLLWEAGGRYRLREDFAATRLMAAGW